MVAAAVERRRRGSTLTLGDGASPLLSASFLFIFFFEELSLLTF
jgi:hypothetical protein